MAAPFVPHPAFDLPDAEELVWRTAPELPPPPDVQLDRAADARPPARPAVLLTRGEELVLFLRLNFARKRAHETADPTWAARARNLEDAVVRYNVGLVLSVARGDEEAEAEGLATLVNASRHFDAARGWKFSTYAMRAVCRTISRLRTRRRAALVVAGRLSQNRNAAADFRPRERAGSEGREHLASLAGIPPRMCLNDEVFPAWVVGQRRELLSHDLVEDEDDEVEGFFGVHSRYSKTVRPAAPLGASAGHA